MTYKSIMVAVSNDDSDHFLADKAFEIASMNNARLTVIHIDNGLKNLFPGVHSHFSDEIISGLKNASDRKLISSLQGRKNVKLRIEQGTLPETLLEAMQKESCDLLICGHHHTFINRLMPVYRGIINKLRADLLIIPLPNM